MPINLLVSMIGTSIIIILVIIGVYNIAYDNGKLSYKYDTLKERYIYYPNEYLFCKWNYINKVSVLPLKNKYYLVKVDDMIVIASLEEDGNWRMKGTNTHIITNCCKNIAWADMDLIKDLKI